MTVAPRVALSACSASSWRLPCLWPAPGFYSLGNLRDMMLSNAPLLLVASGMTFVIIVAQIDISVGSLFAVTALACGALAKHGCPICPAALCNPADGRRTWAQ